jgi:hypothetical protein
LAVAGLVNVANAEDALVELGSLILLAVYAAKVGLTGELMHLLSLISHQEISSY